MPVGFTKHHTIHAITGIRLAAAAAGIRYQNRHDLVLMELAPGTRVAAVFTKNVFRAAPVELAIKHLALAAPRYLLINSGNANAGVGAAGMQIALASTQAVADLMHVQAEQVVPFSTGVIGEQMDIHRITQTLPELAEQLHADGWQTAARAIMTTDTVEKLFSKTIQLQGQAIHITGMAKGSGMIQPNMATMLAYIATDLNVDNAQLATLLENSVEHSFNTITVDSDTSTNDACMLIATGAADLAFEQLSEQEQNAFVQAIDELMLLLAQAIVRDGEGASKFVTVTVHNASSDQQAKRVAFSIANSPLVKTALAASDANWGRIMAAAGKVEDDTLNLDSVDLSINGVQILQSSQLLESYLDEAGSEAMQAAEVTIALDLKLGNATKTVWTTDLTHEYIRINAEYRS